MTQGGSSSSLLAREAVVCPPSPPNPPPPCPGPHGCSAAGRPRPRRLPRRSCPAKRTRSGGTAASTNSTSIATGRPASILWSPSNDPGPSPSDRIHSLIGSLGPRSGLMVTLDGVLATVASSLGDDLLTLGRAGEQDPEQALLGSVASDPHDFVLLNDAFAVDPLVIDVAPGATIGGPDRRGARGVRHRRRGHLPPDGHPMRRSVQGQRRRDRGRSRRRAVGRTSSHRWRRRSGVCGLRARATGCAGDRNSGGRRWRSGLCQRSGVGSPDLAAGPPDQRHWSRGHLGELRGGPRRQLCPTADRFCVAGCVGNQQAAGPHS